MLIRRLWEVYCLKVECDYIRGVQEEERNRRMEGTLKMKLGREENIGKNERLN